MRKKYRVVYKQEIARLKANRDFQLFEKRRLEKEKRRERRKRDRIKKIREWWER